MERNNGRSDRAADADHQPHLSLDDLSQAYAQLLGGTPPPDDAAPEPENASDAPDDTLDSLSDDPRDVTPRGILEAMLFVGHPAGQPLSSREAAQLMRDVAPEEIDELVRQLNDLYDRQSRPYRIASVGAGYCLQLREQYAPLRQKLHGRQRRARLSQAAVDVLAIVAYNQPLSCERINALRGKPAGPILRQLVRKGLLQLSRPDQARPRYVEYHTTDRFLDVFGLESLDDLPRSQDLERS